jgi:hypothetical protein
MSLGTAATQLLLLKQQLEIAQLRQNMLFEQAPPQLRLQHQLACAQLRFPAVASEAAAMQLLLLKQQLEIASLGKRGSSEPEGVWRASQQPDTATLLCRAAISQQQASTLNPQELLAAVAAAQAQPPQMQEGALAVSVHLLLQAKSAAAMRGRNHMSASSATPLSTSAENLASAAASAHARASAGEASNSAYEPAARALGRLATNAHVGAVATLLAAARKGRVDSPSAFVRVQGRLAKTGGDIGTRQLRNAAVNHELIRALASVRGTQAQACPENSSSPVSSPSLSSISSSSAKQPDQQGVQPGAQLNPEEATAILRMAMISENSRARYLGLQESKDSQDSSPPCPRHPLGVEDECIASLHGSYPVAKSTDQLDRRFATSIHDVQASRAEVSPAAGEGPDGAGAGRKCATTLPADADGMASIKSFGSVNSAMSSSGSRERGLEEDSSSPQARLPSVVKCRRKLGAPLSRKVAHDYGAGNLKP